MPVKRQITLLNKLWDVPTHRICPRMVGTCYQSVCGIREYHQPAVGINFFHFKYLIYLILYTLVNRQITLLNKLWDVPTQRICPRMVETCYQSVCGIPEYHQPAVCINFFHLKYLVYLILFTLYNKEITLLNKFGTSQLTGYVPEWLGHVTKVLVVSLNTTSRLWA